MDGSAGDRISALPDELLHVILGFLRDATDVTRTAVLSRRWRRVWVHAAKSLSFFNDHSKRISCTAPDQFVDWVLAHRGETAMDSLVICLTVAGATTTPEQVKEWLRYAGRHVLKSLHVQLGAQKGQFIAVELPGHCKTASISLDLAHHRLRLPATATASYEALTELKLWCPSFVEDEVPVGDFVTSCCPSLRRLSIAYPKALFRLVLRSEALRELEIIRAWDLRTLDVAAPYMRSIKLDGCLHSPMDTVLGNKKVARIEAPRLEEVDMNYNRNSRRPDIEIHGLASVACLRNLRLDMHGRYCRVTDDHLGSWLHHWEEARHVLDKAQLFDLTTEETMANFANVRSMVVVASSFPTRHLVASASSLLMCCPRLRSLHLRISDTTQGVPRLRCFCDGLVDKCNIHGKVALESLEDVVIDGFTGSDQEMQLLSMLFESSSSIKHVALFPSYKHVSLKKRKRVEQGDDGDGATGTTGQGLVTIPNTDRGRWHFAEKTSTWSWYATFGSATTAG